MSNSKTHNSYTVGKIFKSRNIILELMEKRGYDTDDYTNRSINEIGQMLTNKQLDLLLEHSTEKVSIVDEDGNNTTRSKRCHIKYHLQGKVRISQIYEYLDDLYHIEEVLTKKDDFIIIVKEKPNDTLIKLMNNIWLKDGIYFSIFNLHNYLYNILNHELVPPHRILSEEEINNIKTKYNITKNSEFPEISRFDPVALAIGLRPNQVCEIDRPSPTTIKTKYYRLCY